MVVEVNGRMKIRVMENGPYLVEVDGEFSYETSKGEYSGNQKRIALCRCGGSDNKPFCDGTHQRINFKAPGGTIETGE